MRSFILTTLGLICFAVPAWPREAFNRSADIESGTPREKTVGTIGGIHGRVSSIFGFKPPQVEVWNLDKEEKIGPKSVNSIEWIVDIDRAAKTFRTAGCSNRRFFFRTIGFDGKCREKETFAAKPPALAIDPSAVAWDDVGHSCIYYDESTRAIRRHDFVEGKNEVLAPELDFEEVLLTRLDHDRLLVSITLDNSETASWGTSIASFDVNTRKLEKLAVGVLIETIVKHQAALSPSGKYFAFISCGSLRVLDVPNRNVFTLVSKSERDEASVEELHWSPDGSAILFSMSSAIEIARETYTSEWSANMIKLADRQVLKMATTPSGAVMTAGPFSLDSDRIIYEYDIREGGLSGEKVCLTVYNIKSQREEKRLERVWNKLLVDVLDGHNLLFGPPDCF
ncbi:MAG TPA: hypothetical protein VMZ06_16425 [Candidatus Bathyarchaeia archaeon]|nr:hypothetical protein [Candidatus Bathyarchaeia archaeon]